MSKEKVNAKTIEIKHPFGFKSHKPGRPLQLTIGSFNVQHSTDIATIINLARKFDVLFIQEVPLVEEKVLQLEALANAAHRQFYSGKTETGILNHTGIILNPSSFSVLSTSELNMDLFHSDRFTDIRVRTLAGEQLLLLNLYLPTEDKRAQASILSEINFTYSTLQRSSPDLKLLYGGDFNHSMEADVRSERPARYAIADLNKQAHTEDVARYDSQIPEGLEYIKFMGYVRKHDPTFANTIISDSFSPLKMEQKEMNTKLCFQTKRIETLIFQKLVSEDSRESASSTLDMLTLATNYYRDLYSKPVDPPRHDLILFLEPLKSALTREDIRTLNRPFTKKELHTALLVEFKDI
ncbi:hypothetical protein C7M61_003979 [Candidozyma pseudohaemuli]|uniref:Endonuclease/exonuclease/phosphatase domain-containing protein n=1 Tax=Candidozyma pseudohaemuli TaxID=418784 RepID=A0A2P7YKL5_9ASCO|nr:hypothetical protein C7M61_003979 [[Candida] pseudohaemulonii]PSK36506.1 hypothetical protein C7M61_003979 [[Candida] pseudohaemulonii]